MYDIEKMKAEKQSQLERRRKFDRIMNALGAYTPKLLVMKSCALIWLILINPIVLRLVSDRDFNQCSSILTVLALIVLLIKSSDMKKDDEDTLDSKQKDKKHR